MPRASVPIVGRFIAARRPIAGGVDPLRRPSPTEPVV
jgi:hypothetical protein